MSSLTKLLPLPNITVPDQKYARIDNNPDFIIHAAAVYLSLSTLAILIYTGFRSCCLSLMAPRLSKQTKRKRRRQASSREYNERIALLREENEELLDENRFRLKGYLRYFSWVSKSFDMSEEELIRICGLDAYFTLRLIRLSFKVMMVYNVVGVFVLIPFYKMQVPTHECQQYCLLHPQQRVEKDYDAYTAECICSSVDQMSLANLKSEGTDLSLWVPVFAMLYFSASAMILLWREYKEVIRIRLHYWKSRPPNLYTVLVQGIPKRLQSSSGDILKEHFEKLFPGTVFNVTSLQHPSDALSILTSIGEERFYLINQLEYAFLVQELNIKGDCYCAFNCLAKTSTEDVALLFAELHQLNERFAKLKNAYLEMLECNDKSLEKDDLLFKRHMSELEILPNASDRTPNFPVAFVTFRSLATAMIAVQSQLYDSHKLRVTTAPEPRDIIWSNLGLDNKAIVTRKLISRAIFVFVILFWGVFTSFIGAATSTGALARTVPWIRDLLEKYPNLTSYFDQLAPLVLAGIVSIVNPLLWILTRFEGHISYSQIDLWTMEKYFMFLVVQVFVFYSVAGTVAKTVVEILQQPQKIVETLATTLPKNASFYIGFIFVEVFWLLALELLRVYDMLFAIFRRIITLNVPETPRMKRTTICGTFPFSTPSPRNLSSTNAQILLIFFIASTYAPIQPLVLPSSMIFFAFANLVFTTVFTSSSKQAFDSSGRAWSSIFWCLIVALITSQLTMIGVLLTRGAFSHVLIMSILVAITVFLAYLLDSTYWPIAHDLPIFLASQLDYDTKDGSTEDENEVKVVELQPSIWRYSTLTPGHDDDAHRRAPVPRNVVNVYKYIHPVLSEKDNEYPEKENGEMLYNSSAPYGSI